VSRENAAAGGKQACCMVSELLEEAGIDREQLRRVRRQLLEGIVLACQWQLERMNERQAARPARPERKGRKVRVD
jgi:hypothetical protein